MRGAIREDDVMLGLADGQPQDDPYSPLIGFMRVFNHFYDPVNRQPLNKDGIPVGQITCAAGAVIGPITGVGIAGGLAIGCQPTETTPKWAIGSSDVFTSLNTPNSSRRNHFTIFDAREAMYRALTGRGSDGKPLQPGKTLTKQEDIRNAYWATTFRALGDVVHLVQDMGQPQHTRNDSHAGTKYNGNEQWERWVGHKSVFENYIEAAAKGESFVTSDKNVVSGTPYITVKATSLNYGGYDAVTFTNYLSYFTTPGTGDIPTRQGLADYSNRGFFSAGKNLNNNEYLYPSNNPLDYGRETKLYVNWASKPIDAASNASVTLLMGTVPDSLRPGQTATNVPLTTEGIWDQFLVQKDGTHAYTLNRINYDAMANLLIPRAVGYSAGLINYFFRGKIDFIPDPNHPGKYIIKNLGPEEMKGTFTLYYDAEDGNRYPVAGSSPDKTWEGLTIPAGGQADDLSYTEPTDPSPKAAGEYVLVFNGDMGQELHSDNSVGAVVAKVVKSPGSLLISRYVNHWLYETFRSQDGGSTWKSLGLHSDAIGNLTYIGGNVVLGTSSISYDGGQSWMNLLFSTELFDFRMHASPLGGGAVISTRKPCQASAPKDGEVCVSFSSDQGITWATPQRTGIAYANYTPVYMGGNRLVVRGYYPVGSSNCPPPFNLGQCNYFNPALYYSSDGGSSWTNIYDGDFDKIIYLGGNTLFANRYVRLPGSYVHQFVMSTDGGVTWAQTGFPFGMAYGAPYYFQLGYLVYAGNKTIYAHFWGIDPYTYYYRQYLYKSPDNGVTWLSAGALPLPLRDPGMAGMTFVGNPGTIPGFK